MDTKHAKILYVRKKIKCDNLIKQYENVQY